MARLSIEVTDQQHQQIKAVAALQGKSIRDYALERLIPMTQDEENAMQELKALLNDRIESAMRGEVSTKTIDEIFDEVMSEQEGKPV